MGQKTKHLRITLVKSPIGRIARHKGCLHGLGLKKMHRSVVLADTPSIRGMVNMISYLLQVEEI